MKILLISSGSFFSTYGGGQVYVKSIVDEMILQQYDCCIVSCSTLFPENISSDKYKGKTIYSVNPQSSFIKIKELVHEIKPDIVHAHGEKALFCQIAHQLNIPCIVTAHHGGIVCPAGTLMNTKNEICPIKANHTDCLKCCLKNIRSGSYWYPFMRLIPTKQYIQLGKFLKKIPFIPFITPIGGAALAIEQKRTSWQTISQYSNVLIAPSTAIAEAMQRNGLDAEKIRVIPHGIPLPTETIPFPETHDKIRFYYVGRICYVKGIHIMLKAFHQVKNKKIELHIIGGAGNKKEKVYFEKLQKRYISDSKIIWYGKIKSEDINSLVKEFHVLIHPAIYLEVFGLNIAEALALGKPVLSTKCGGAEMQIKEGENGWLISPNDVKSLQEKMKEIIYCNSLRGITPRTESITTHVQKLYALYKNITEQNEETSY